MRKMKIILSAVVLLSLALSSSVFSSPITIKASASPKVGGTIDPPGKVSIYPGADQTFVIRPTSGYEIKDVVVDKMSLKSLGEEWPIYTYTFTNITSNHSIKVTFQKRKYNVTATSEEGATITPYGTKYYYYGKKQTYTITPPNTDILPIALVDGKEVQPYDLLTNPYGLKKAGNGYKFVLLITGDHSIKATIPIPAVASSSVKPLDSASLTWHSEDWSTLHFSQSTLQVGDIIAEGGFIVAGGLLRKVIAVSYGEPQGYIVQTIEAGIDEAIESGQIKIGQALLSTQVTSIVAPEGVSLIVTPQTTGLYLTLDDMVLYDHDKNLNTKDDQIRMTGTLLVEPDVSLYVSSGFQNVTFTATLSEEINIDFEASVVLRDLTVGPKFIPEIQVLYAPIPIVAPFIYAIPRLRIAFGIDGDVSADIKSNITQRASFTMGASYNDGDITPIGKLAFDLDFTPPHFTVTAQAKAYVGPYIDLLINGIPGPYGMIKDYLEFNVDPTANPWWELYGGIEADVGIFIKLCKRELINVKIPGVVGVRRLLANSWDNIYDGLWYGSWHGWYGGGSLDVELFQAEYGSTINGFASASNSGMPLHQFFLGEVDGDNIKWVTADYGRCNMTATGGAVSPGYLSGTYKVTCSGVDYDNGTWSLSKQP